MAIVLKVHWSKGESWISASKFVLADIAVLEALHGSADVCRCRLEIAKAADLGHCGRTAQLDF